MDFHGNINLKDNEMQQLVFEQETSFPVDAVAGSIVFKDNALYMCVALNVADPIWIPLTSSIDTYVHEQTSTATTWTITHNLGEENVILQVYNDSNEMIIPDTVTPTDTNEIVMTFNTAIAGRAIIMFGDEIPANGIGIIEPPSADPDISNVVFNSVNLSTPGIDNHGIYVKEDGTKLYSITFTTVKEYTLSTPGDLSTATQTGSEALSNVSSAFLYGLHISEDGLNLYTGDDDDSHKIKRYTLSTPWLLSSISYHSSYITPSQPSGVALSSDGLQMTVSALSGNFRYYTLGTSWDITTATFGGNGNVTQSSITDMFISPTGLRMMLTGYGFVRQYTLGTAWDTTTATYDNISVGLPVSSRGLGFFSNAKMYVGITNGINEYDI